MAWKSLDALASSPRFFGGLLAATILARVTLAAFGYQGDARPEARARALRHFPAASIDRGLEYSRAGFSAAVASMLLGQAALLAFLVGGFSARLSSACLAWSGGRPWLQVLLYLAIVLLASEALEAPFSYYLDFVLEHRFGFSKLSLPGWIAYQAKQLAVGGALALALGSGGYWLLRRFPSAWVWIVPVAALALQFGLTYLYPRLLLPIFYKIERAQDPELAAEIEKVAEKVGVHLKSIYIINESQYSSHTNAFFTGFGKFKEIYLYDTLLKDHSRQEVAAILAHELGHWRRNHVMKGLLLSEAGIALACLALYLVFPAFARAPFLKAGPLSDVASLPLLALLASVVEFWASPVAAGVSRRFEREADADGLALCGCPQVYVRDFQQLAESNRSNLLPHPAVVFWRYSHPPIVDRIEAVTAGRPE